MTIIEAMSKAINQAKISRKLCYLYTNNDGYYVSSRYREGWLFMAYPGGRKVLSTKGEQLVYEILGK